MPRRQDPIRLPLRAAASLPVPLWRVCHYRVIYDPEPAKNRISKLEFVPQPEGA